MCCSLLFAVVGCFCLLCLVCWRLLLRVVCSLFLVCVGRCSLFDVARLFVVVCCASLLVVGRCLSCVVVCCVLWCVIVCGCLVLSLVGCCLWLFVGVVV